MKKQPLFVICPKGLRQQVDKARSFLEPIQNSLDTDCKNIFITLEKKRGDIYRYTIKDDCPIGFKDLSHAFTAYAPSEKKSDATKRGRFNLGEKYFISVCEHAILKTTSGQVIFNVKEGYREETGHKIDKGTILEAEIRLTEEEYGVVLSLYKELLIPSRINVTFNGEKLGDTVPIFTFIAKLPTLKEDKNGYLKTCIRETMISLYKKVGQSKLYELGIPIVDFDCSWDIDIGQKVPLNKDRDNVTESYKKELLSLIVNNTPHLLTEKEISEPWIDIAIKSKNILPKSLEKVIKLKFGEHRASFTPEDPQSVKAAVAAGFNIVHGTNLSREAWENVRKAGLISSSGKLFPTPQAYSTDGELEKVIPTEEWTDGFKKVAGYSKMLAKELLGIEIQIKFTYAGNNFLACYGHNVLTFNITNLGKTFYKDIEYLDSLIIHELAHHIEGDHLSEKYYKACCDLGAKLKSLALRKPELFIGFK